MKRVFCAALAASALTLPLAAQDAAPAPSPAEIVAGADAAEWIAIPAEDLLVMTLAPDRDGKARRVVIQLMPEPFSQGWIANIRTLARAGWYDGISVNRVQDNYVTQWGDPNYDNPEAEGKAKPLPEGLQAMAESAYTASMVDVTLAWNGLELTDDNRADFADFDWHQSQEADFHNADASVKATQTEHTFAGWHQRDPYAEWVEFYRGWPVGSAGSSGDAPWWPVHCYGMVGVGRGMSPDTGSGAELYTVIGHAPRHLDRNIALVGRVIEGMEHLSSLPRGSGDLGFYTAEEADKRTPILSIRVASDLPATERPRFEYLSTEGDAFARYAEARANRRDPFFIVPAGGADICNVPVPIRKALTAD
ncbi:peptidylprolyl isomerase [Qipengyuania spongiae]|uniref:Peptidylprolyl isomerase n=1 Tax=Qipengyuania spongiae TaxID=2909673 RepID=A0ABY5T1I2_9SPHN|nr:peptidylprolyl isomerase [Qipengyuania spongiae]UVI40633.1 peptidylprolyl isomerase [Qipengyuania spongiae]